MSLVRHVSQDREIVQQILLGKNIEDKLIPLPIQMVKGNFGVEEFPSKPGRPQKLLFSEETLRFPRRGSLKEDSQRAKAIHAFANHELLAIEMMASVYLKFPAQSEEDLFFLKGLANTIKDEQKHLSLYIGRLNAFGVDFGDFPVNSFFWEYLSKINSREQYLAVMALTFESANLDFAFFYNKLFNDLGDVESAKVMNIILEDEISHVAFGRQQLKKKSESKGLWEYYCELLPWPLTPARAKGIQYMAHLREQAGLPTDFIDQLQNYDDHYPATSRKEWKMAK